MAFLPAAFCLSVSAWHLAGPSSTSRAPVGLPGSRTWVTNSRIVDAQNRWMVIRNMVGRKQPRDLEEQMEGGSSRVF